MQSCMTLDDFLPRFRLPTGLVRHDVGCACETRTPASDSDQSNRRGILRSRVSRTGTAWGGNNGFRWIFVVEPKGVRLKESEDTECKRSVFDTCGAGFRWGVTFRVPYGMRKPALRKNDE